MIGPTEQQVVYKNISESAFASNRATSTTMSPQLQYHAYEGTGTHNLEAYYYNQAVRLPAGADRVELAGQGIIDNK